MNAIAAETDVSKRAALAQAAFGRGGQEIIDMATDLNEKRKEARASGSLISEEDQRAGAALHATFIRLKASGMGFLNGVLGRLARVIGPILEKWSAWIVANRELIKQRIDQFINGIVTAVRTAVKIWKAWGPSILIMVGAFVALKGAMQITALVKNVSIGIRGAGAALQLLAKGGKVATVMQMLFNGSLFACPITWIVLGIAAVIAIVVLLVRNWDKVVAVFKAAGRWIAQAFRTVRDWIYKALDNPLIRAAALIFAPFITIPILIAKHWQEIIGVIKSVIDWIGTPAGKVGRFFGLGGGGGRRRGRYLPRHPGLAERRRHQQQHHDDQAEPPRYSARWLPARHPLEAGWEVERCHREHGGGAPAWRLREIEDDHHRPQAPALARRRARMLATAGGVPREARVPYVQDPPPPNPCPPRGVDGLTPLCDP